MTRQEAVESKQTHKTTLTKQNDAEQRKKKKKKKRKTKTPTVAHPCDE
jgi:hypothetical protein